MHPLFCPQKAIRYGLHAVIPNYTRLSSSFNACLLNFERLGTTPRVYRLYQDPRPINASTVQKHQPLIQLQLPLCLGLKTGFGNKCEFFISAVPAQTQRPIVLPEPHFAILTPNSQPKTHICNCIDTHAQHISARPNTLAYIGCRSIKCSEDSNTRAKTNRRWRFTPASQLSTNCFAPTSSVPVDHSTSTGLPRNDVIAFPISSY